MSTKIEKRTEVRGNGFITLGQASDKETVLMFVEREPDNLLAGAMYINKNKQNYNFIVRFTDRHSINYDVTKYCREHTYNQILILCPSINEYTVMYLNRTNVEYAYYGSTTKLLAEYVNEHVHVMTRPVTELFCEKYEFAGSIYEEVIAYTNRFFPDEMDLFDGIKYQYLCFNLSAKELFLLFLAQVDGGKNKLSISDELIAKFADIYDKQMQAIEKQIKAARFVQDKENPQITFAFLKGGCPCTLILNAARRKMNADVFVNYCLHRQHFTVLAKDNMTDIYNQYIKRFIYSGCGSYSGGGCFEKDSTDERFINAFMNHFALHGFYKDREQAYSTFVPEEYEWIESMNGLTDKKIYKNFNFTIFIDSRCNADCRFCIEQIKTENTGTINKCRIDSQEEYVAKLDFALGKIRELNPSISITGGEPLISPWFRDACKLLKKYQFRKTVITTNGTNILEQADVIIDAGIHHVNFSRPHYNPEIIQKIMRFQEPRYADSFDELKQAIKLLEENGVKTRFNCILSKHGISTVSDMKNYMEYIRSLGCKHVVFRELMSFDENGALNEEKKQFAANERVWINDLWKQIDADEAFTYDCNMQGHYYYIEIYKYKDMTMVSERANLKCLEDSYVKNEDYIYEMVFHPSGRLCAGWDDSKQYILG